MQAVCYSNPSLQRTGPITSLAIRCHGTRYRVRGLTELSGSTLPRHVPQDGFEPPLASFGRCAATRSSVSPILLLLYWSDQASKLSCHRKSLSLSGMCELNTPECLASKASDPSLSPMPVVTVCLFLFLRLQQEQYLYFFHHTSQLYCGNSDKEDKHLLPYCRLTVRSYGEDGVLISSHANALGHTRSIPL
jgi:hypothetical protein